MLVQSTGYGRTVSDLTSGPTCDVTNGSIFKGLVNTHQHQTRWRNKGPFWKGIAGWDSPLGRVIELG